MVLTPNSKHADSPTGRATRDAVTIWRAGVHAANGRQRVSDYVRTGSGGVAFGPYQIPQTATGRLCVIGAGKAALAMTMGLLDGLQGTDWIRDHRVLGHINVADDAVPDETGRLRLTRAGIACHPVRPANVNLPTRAAVRASIICREMTRTLSREDICLVLLSGGGSSLLAIPRSPVSLDDKLAVIECLTSGGADITELNLMRAAISDIKFGGLIRHCSSQHIVTLVLSDIIGDPLHLIAGGPTSPVPVDYEQAIRIAVRYDPERRRLPPGVWKLLDTGPTEPPTSTDESTLRNRFVVGNIETAVDASVARARSLGYRVEQEVVGEKQTSDEKGLELFQRLAKLPPGTCFISGGEPVVILAPPELRGDGGRNQQLALAALRQAMKTESIPSGDWCLLSGGTDGQDGTTSAAGAFVNPNVASQVTAGGLDVDSALRCNDAWPLFQRTGSLLITGPTETNVGDLRILLRTETETGNEPGTIR